ncbi:MAG: DNA methyltransferase [Kiritimatiellia bacterium]|nr:DNA methyltransferase [Kiritimatiellia bacterium]
MKLARNLLRDDGVLFVSLDDNEIFNLRKISDEVFGEKNFLGMIVLKTATDNNGSQVTTEHEYLFCVAKRADVQQGWKRKSEAAAKIIAQYGKIKMKFAAPQLIQDALRKWIKDNRNDLPQVAHYNNVDEKGVYSSSGNSSNPHPGGYMFDILHPKTGRPCPKPANGWRWPEATFASYAKSGEVEWGIDETTQPHIKKRIETATESLRSLIYEDNRGTTKELSELFDGKKVFDNPKPYRLLARIMDFVTTDDSIVLDFFAGSSTTAHAVFHQNVIDGGTRKFIMVQLPEVCAEGSEAAKAGYKNICEIGKERIRRAGKKIIDEFDEKRKVVAGSLDLDGGNTTRVGSLPDIGFRVLKLDSSSLNDTSATVSETSQAFENFDRIKSDRSPEDLLFQMLLETRIPLSEPIVKAQVAGNEVFFVGVPADAQDKDALSGAPLAACLDQNAKMTTEFFIEVAKLKPGIAFFRDDAFADDSARTNLQQAFDQFSPSTSIKVI